MKKPVHQTLLVTGLILNLRFKLFLRRMTKRGTVGATISFTLALGLSSGLGIGGYYLFGKIPAIYSNPVWMAFALSLYFFLVGLFWILWPVIAAQIDEAYELSRFFNFPVRPGRLYLIQSALGLFEPSVLFFYPALLGAGLGLASSLKPGGKITLLLMLAYTIMHVTT